MHWLFAGAILHNGHTSCQLGDLVRKRQRRFMLLKKCQRKLSRGCSSASVNVMVCGRMHKKQNKQPVFNVPDHAHALQIPMRTRRGLVPSVQA